MIFDFLRMKKREQKAAASQVIFQAHMEQQNDDEQKFEAWQRAHYDKMAAAKRLEKLKIKRSDRGRA